MGEEGCGRRGQPVMKCKEGERDKVSGKGWAVGEIEGSV